MATAHKTLIHFWFNIGGEGYRARVTNRYKIMIFIIGL